ncbi:protein VACUOLELESS GAMETOPHYTES-like [Lolium perenne]|uniref:protein VACUOLELESS GAMETOPHYTES-like n=1 Tax=Lolium perenne TaxID=4522 RepID=UPI0021EA464E|nr:uncharacterized protein LOC127330832 [Lolium perenne]
MTRTEEDAHPAVISHPAHPQHKLQRAVVDAKFKCDGCMQLGKGRSYRCEPCDYDIHTRCAPTESSLKHHLLKNCKLDFRLKPPGPGCWCDACGDECLGFLYSNRDRNVDLHPRCAFLPQQVVIDGVPFELHTKKESALTCFRCQQKGARRNTYWSYRSRDSGEHRYVHVGCLIDGTRGKEESVPTPTELVNNPGKGAWYKSIWKFTKIVAKLSFYLITFDAMGIFTMAGDVVDCFM